MADTCNHGRRQFGCENCEREVAAMSEHTESRSLVIETCPVHGGIVSTARPCREIVARVDGRTTYCHEAEEIEVIPAEQLVKVEAERDEAREERITIRDWWAEHNKLNAAERDAATQQLGGLSEGLRAEIGLLETTATNAGSEAISLGAEGKFDGEKEAKLIEAIANNSLRSLRALLGTYSVDEGSGA